MDYRADDQPHPPEHSDEDPLWELPRYESYLIDEFELGRLAHALDASHPDHVTAQICGQQLIDSGESEQTVLLVPREIWVPFAELDERAASTLLDRRYAPATVPPLAETRGFLARLFAPLPPPESIQPPGVPRPEYERQFATFRVFLQSVLSAQNALFVMVGP